MLCGSFGLCTAGVRLLLWTRFIDRLNASKCCPLCVEICSVFLLCSVHTVVVH